MFEHEVFTRESPAYLFVSFRQANAAAFACLFFLEAPIGLAERFRGHSENVPDTEPIVQSYAQSFAVLGL